MPFSDSDTAQGGRAFLLSEANPLVVGGAKDNNANFAWVQLFIHHVAPQGMVGFVLANGSMSSNQSGKGDIHRAFIVADLVDCTVALPGQLFCSTQIPVFFWFVAKSKAADAKRCFRDHRKQSLFIDAHKLGTLIDHALFDFSIN